MKWAVALVYVTAWIVTLAVLRGPPRPRGHNLWGGHPVPRSRGALGTKRRVQMPPDFKNAPRSKGFDVGILEAEAKVKGAAKNAAIIGHTERPTPDQMYLASRINATASSSRLSPASLQKLNSRFGVATVSSAMRLVHGFPPDELRSAYAYLARVCAQKAIEEAL